MTGRGASEGCGQWSSQFWWERGTGSAEKSAERTHRGAEGASPGAALGPGKSPQSPRRASALSLGCPGTLSGGGVWSATNTLVIAVYGIQGWGCLRVLIPGTPGQASASVAKVNSS